ncbi:bifunctional peptidase and arginyl-hydroxylase JMJD5 [Anopheles moucheti]|uniref:bifunctional peptidase and arginyl-hydroxylase JMJD5 n=1 Tax=Anopheles moucheti TaxID=186751 RepID=UPI0022F0744C|nr:bifunctional peptidase and arginyl-hydroxylase JMJD5 [Anopheles moucheti]
MEQCREAIISIVSDKSFILNRECVKENHLYHVVLSAVLEPLSKFSERSQTEDKNIATNLIKIGVLYDTVYNRLHTGQWNTVEPAERELFTIITYVRIIYTLWISASNADSIKDSIYLADLGLMLGYPIETPCNSGTNDLLTETASTLSNYLSEIVKQEPPRKRLRMNTKIENVRPIESHLNNIPVLQCPSVDFFGQQCYDLKQPAVLKGIIDGWPAMERWHDPNYLLNVAGERTVPIELGSQYSNDDWSQKLMKFRDFVEQNLCSETTSSSSEQRAAYLAQHDLFDQIPALRADIAVPDYIGRTDARPRIKAWLGPKGTVSPLHTDPCHNLLCQVFGAKIIILARPEDTEKLYPHDHFILSNTSQVDARQVDYERFPLAREVSFHRLTLHRGEVLYIPPKWWHYVESLSPSFSVSFWFE